MVRTIATLVMSLLVLGVIVYFLRTMLGTDPKALARMIDRADRVVVLDNVETATVLFESTDRKDLDALKAALAVTIPPRPIHCACYGAERITLYANGEEIGWVSNQHCKNIRFSEWHSDAELLDPETFITWFDQRKIPGPREYVEQEKARAKEAEESERQWIAAMPAALSDFWPAMKNSFDTDTKPLNEALVMEIPDRKDRILALCSWYGSGRGRWSGFPIYEDVPEKLLLEYSLPDLLDAVNRDSLTETQLEGAARFFAGWTFSQKRPIDLTQLPGDLKVRLLKHSLKSKDEDKRQRATKAFAQKDQK